MTKERRSPCPIAYALDLFGDRWTLLVLRDLILGGKHYFQEFLEAGEGIATNILSERLTRLEQAGLLTKKQDPDDGKRFIYRPTRKATDALPILLELIAWSGQHDPETPVSDAFLKRIREQRSELEAELLRKLEERPAT